MYLAWNFFLANRRMQRKYLRDTLRASAKAKQRPTRQVLLLQADAPALEQQQQSAM